MSNYLKLFEKTNEYNQYIEGDSFLLPNVSHTEDTLKVYYNPIPPHDYSKDYFTIVVIEGSHIGFNDSHTDGVYISKDNGETWELCDNGVDVSEGDTISVKCMINGSYSGYNFITSTDNTFKAKIQGNIMSLLFGDNFMGVTVLENKYLNGLFKKSEWLIDAQNLVLPARRLTSYCYNSMFANCSNLVYAPKILPARTLENTNACYANMFISCTSLVTVPELPATTLADSCYFSMFQGCSSLVTAPELPATTLENGCYNSMFANCSNLVTAPELPATTLANNCYYDMFLGCSSLVTTPVLPAMTLANNCYLGMFHGCSNLVYAPELPAETLADSCYREMFLNCSNLVYAPELPAETLANNCYLGMFKGCTSLVTAPELPATTLENGCYNSMFQGCTSLNYVKALFITDISQYTIYTSGWLDNTSATGIFVGNVEASWLDNIERGNSTVPDGWTIVRE